MTRGLTVFDLTQKPGAPSLGNVAINLKLEEFEKWMLRVLLLEFRIEENKKFQRRLTAEERRLDPRRLPA